MRSFKLPVSWFVFLTVLACGLPGYAAEKWSSIRSKNFLLVGNASDSSMKRVGRNLEEFRTAFVNLFPGVSQQSAIGTTVIVFKDDDSFRPYKPLYEGKAGNVAGYFQPGSDVNFIALSADMQSPHVVYHEFVHSLTKDTSLPLPAWASEGLAEVYSMFEVTGKDITLGRAIAEHISLLNRQQMLPLELLFSVETGSPYYNEKNKQGMFYAESWAAVHYLMFGNEGKRRAQFSKYLSLVSNAKTIDENFREAFQTDFKTLEEEIRKYVQDQQRWPAITVKLQNKLDFDRDMQASSLSEAQAQYYLGDLLLHTNRLEAAETQLQKAATLDPQFAATYASLGLLKIRQRKDEEALRFLTQAVDGDSQNHLAHYYYAQLLEKLDERGSAEDRKSRMDVMRTHVQKTIELAPRFAEAYSMLGYIALVSQEGVAEAEASVKKAIEYAPGRMDLRLRLAQLMLSNSETSAAQALLRALKNSAAEDSLRYEAERLLDDIQNRQQIEKDFREYQQRRREAEEAASDTTVEDKVADGPPKITRNSTPSKTPDGSVIETAKPQMRLPEGVRIEGVLTQVDCSDGLTLHVNVGTTTVELHTDTPSKLELVSYVSAVQDSFSCGVMKPGVPVAVVYKRGGDGRFLGEPLRVDFINPN